MGWASKSNGELLALATGGFDVFVTADRNLSYQQDVSAFDPATASAPLVDVTGLVIYFTVALGLLRGTLQ
jgi:hypothetical protein